MLNQHELRITITRRVTWLRPSCQEMQGLGTLKCLTTFCYTKRNRQGFQSIQNSWFFWWCQRLQPQNNVVVLWYPVNVDERPDTIFGNLCILGKIVTFFFRSLAKTWNKYSNLSILAGTVKLLSVCSNILLPHRNKKQELQLLIGSRRSKHTAIWPPPMPHFLEIRPY